MNRSDLWEVNIALRLYIILSIMIYPLFFFLIQLQYLSPLGLIILGGSFLLILKCVIFNPQKGAPKGISPQICILSGIVLNFIFSLAYFIENSNFTLILFIISILIGSIIYFSSVLYIKPFKRINSFLMLKLNQWKDKRINVNVNFLIKRLALFWLAMSLVLLFVPYPVYLQDNKTHINTKPHRDFGIWTYGQSLNEDNIGEPEYITNQTLEILGKANIYFVYGLNVEKLESNLVKNLLRCRDHNIEVHISINPIKISYTNIWSFEKFQDDIEEVLIYLNSHNLIGRPVTTLVYDMEVMPDAKYPFYGFNLEVVSQLNEYEELETKFRRFNNRIRDEYDLKIRITTDISQGFDLKDGDNDLMVFSGLMSYEKAEMAYMVYRRETLGQNVILDHCKFLEEGDIIVLNAWRDIGSLCWKNIDCAIKDARLVLGCPKKAFRLEIWSLSHFLYSFGENGLIALVDAINQDISDWSIVSVWNIFPYSFLWDAIFLGYILIDLYGPLLRTIYKIF